MLKKLLKYEFQATARTYAALYLVLAAVSLMLGVNSGAGMRAQLRGGYYGGSGIDSILTVLYIAAIVALVAVTLYTVVQRFNKNLLGREGYLMHTLPVTTSQLILSKLISATLWSVCSVVMGFASFLIMGVGMTLASGTAFGQLIRDIFSNSWGELIASFRQSMGISIAEWAVWLFLLLLAAGMCTILCMYASCMVAHQFKKFSVLVGIATYFVLTSAQSWLENVIWSTGGEFVFYRADSAQLNTLNSALTSPDMLAIALPYIIMSLAFGAAYFALTAWLMNEKLNLE